MAKAGYDYDAAKALLLKGLNLKQISDQLSIPYAALQQTARRHKWQTDRHRVRQVVSDHVESNLTAQATRWVERISSKATETLDALSTYDFASKVHQLKPEEWLRSLETLDRLARRTYGLDEQQGGGRPGVMVQVNAVQGVAAASGETAKPAKLVEISLPDGQLGGEAI